MTCTPPGTTAEQPHDQLLDTPPSAKLVYKTLELEGPMTQLILAEETRLNPRTVRYALTELKEIGLVIEEVYLPDARKKLYRLTDPD